MQQPPPQGPQGPYSSQLGQVRGPSQQPGMMPPGMPPPKKKLSRGCLIGLGIVGILFLCGLANAAIHSGSQSSTSNATTIVATMQPRPTQQSYAVATEPVLLPTTTPSPTPTIQPTATTAPTLSNEPARLGSNINAFTARYGQPDVNTDVSIGRYHYQKYGDSNIDFLIVWTDASDGASYAQLIYYITVQADESGWTPTQANAMCGALYPSDAVYQNQVPVGDNAIDKIYYSASLANLFPASSFTDAEQNTVKPGTFDVQVLYEDSSETLVNSCNIIIGEQQTKP